MSENSENSIAIAVRYAEKVNSTPQQSIRLSQTGKPFDNLANATALLRADPKLCGKFRYNEFSRTVEQVASIYSPICKGENSCSRSLMDCDVILVQEYLQRGPLLNINLRTVHDAIDVVAHENSYNPVRDWLDLLEWDGQARLENWLFTYMDGQAPNEYMACVGKMFVIGMVARIYDPGCQADYTLILEGKQGAQKSSACRILGGEYFSDALPSDVSNKDAAVHLRGKWLIEIAEMHAFTKSETASLKAFLTRRTEIYRPPYGRREVHEARQCMFIGTTNRQRYLRDETGARRFWPLQVGKIDLTGLAGNRDQLFAEAVVRYKQGEQWWPSPLFETEYMRPEQSDRREDEPWEEPIASYLLSVDRATVGQIATNALNFDNAKIRTNDTRRIAGVLQTLGWDRAPRGPQGQRYWMRAGTCAR